MVEVAGTNVEESGVSRSGKVVSSVDGVQKKAKNAMDGEMSELPILQYEAEIKEMISENETSILIGQTGSGKTTRLPKMVVDVMGEGKKVFVTQPRVVAATSIAEYVAGEMGTRVGEKVGHHVRFDNSTSENTDITFGTDGILLAKLNEGSLLEEYDCIVIDEAHERSLNIDFLLGLLKEIQKKRKEKGMDELKLIVTSATIEKEKFTQYFGDAPSLEVPGRLHDVEVKYLKNTPRNKTDLYNVCVGAVQDIQNTSESGDILIFMPGQYEIDRVVQNIEDLYPQDLEVLPLYGSLSVDQQKKVFKKSKKRRIIVSTNIAETSVTIPGIKYVIDSGLIKQKDYDPRTGIDSLASIAHSKAGCTQRTGRAGRVGPGKCYRLYTKEDFETRESFTKPEIQRSNLSSVILKMKLLGIDNIAEFDFMDKPDINQINKAIEFLKILGALDQSENVTEVGKNISKFPLEPHIAKMFIEAGKYLTF